MTKLLNDVISDIDLVVGQRLDALQVDDVLRSLPDAWPYLLPSWLRSTERSLAGATPWHAMARRGAAAAFLPQFLFRAPGVVDCDPRTYLGWQPPSGETACCGVTSACCASATAKVEALGAERFFPALVIGSPLGYRSEAGATTAEGPLLYELTRLVIRAALDAGVRSIVAPWVPARPGNAALLEALRHEGAHVSFWGEENFMPLEHASYDEHLAALPARKRRRVKEDYDKAAASGVVVRRVDGVELRPFVTRIAELTCLNRQKHDGNENPAHIEALLSGLIDDGADVRAYLGYLGSEVVASCLTIRHCNRMIVKWAGFDYAALGERSGVYFTLVLDLPLRDAYAERLSSVEIGPGADQAKRLRGCRPRGIETALLVADEALRPTVTALQDEVGRERREALSGGDGGSTSPSGATGLLSRLRGGSPNGSGCCG